MSRPKIRHLALYTPDTDKLAAFYVSVFDMEIKLRAGPTLYQGGDHHTREISFDSLPVEMRFPLRFIVIAVRGFTKLL